MQKGIRKHAWLYVIVAVLVAVVLVSLYYQFGYLPQKQKGTSFPGTVGSSEPYIAGGPMCISATLSFSNATGFVTTVRPNSGTIEFVLLPNSVGEFTVTYTGWDFNNLTIPSLNPVIPVGNSVSVLNVNLSNGTLGTSSGLSVTESNVTWVIYYQVIVNYTVTSGESNGLYVLGLPSAGFGTIVDVGTQPYTGPQTWLEGPYS